MKSDGAEIIIYQTEDGRAKIDIRMEDKTIWLTQAQMTELFQTKAKHQPAHYQYR